MEGPEGPTGCWGDRPRAPGVREGGDSACATFRLIFKWLSVTLFSQSPPSRRDGPGCKEKWSLGRPGCRRGPAGSPEARVQCAPLGSAGARPARGGGAAAAGAETALTASCRAAAAEAGTARRQCPRGPRPRGPGARRPGSRSSQSWRLWRARRHTGTGRRWPAGTGRRPGWPACTQCRARTVTGLGPPGSPRWAGRWLVGRCSGGSACGAKQRGSGSGSDDRAGKHSGSGGVEVPEEPGDAVSPLRHLYFLICKMGAFTTIMGLLPQGLCTGHAHNLHSTFPSDPQGSHLPSSSLHSNVSSVNPSRQHPPSHPTHQTPPVPHRSNTT